MKILFHIAGFPVHFFGLMIALAILGGFYVIDLVAVRKGLDKEKIFNFAIYTILSGVFGARIFYIVFYNFQYYLTNPTQILMINQGGLSIHGAIVGGLLFAIWYTRKNNLDFWVIADTFAPGIILGQGIGRIGCDVFGRAMEIPRFWAVNYNGQLVHPTQIYEAVLNFIAFFILWRKTKNQQYKGEIFLWYIILFSINRGIVEFFRVNPMVGGVISISHILSILMIIGAVIAMFYFKKITISQTKFNFKDNWNSDYSLVLIKDVVSVSLLTAVSVFIYYRAWM